jgi:glycosyltransferase involved in cell wall biosynthesis
MIVFGNFGSDGQVNGQVVKTKELVALLDTIGVEYSVFDTSRSGVVQMLREIYNKEDKLHVICLGKKGVLLYYLACLIFLKFKTTRVFVVVGGWFPEYLSKIYINALAACFKNCSVYLVESNKIRARVQELTYKSDFLSNFRLSLSDGVYIERKYDHEIRLIFISRLIVDKGVYDAIKLADVLVKNAINVVLDIYGVGSESEVTALQNAIVGKSYVNFCGAARPEMASEVISGYHFLVLPTRYHGECMPGVVVEAFSTGTPVISTNWRYMPEMVVHDKTGGVFFLNSFVEDACDWLMVMTADKYSSLQHECIIEYRKRLSPKAAADVLVRYLANK